MYAAKTVTSESYCNNATLSLLEDWHNWCRLCAKTVLQNINIYLKSVNNTSIGSIKQIELQLSMNIKKYFNVEIKPDDDLPKRLCAECFSLVASLVDFNERVEKVQQMYYFTLQNVQGGIEVNLSAMRLKYGISEDYQTQMLMHSSLTETLAENVSPTSDSETEMHTENSVVTKPDENLCRFVDNDEVECEDPFASDIEISNGGDENLKATSENGITRSKNELLETKRNIKPKPKNSLHTSESESTVYKYSCDKCPLRFQRIGNYRVHLNKKHGVTGFISPVSCPHCSRSFKSQFFLKRHITTHQPRSELELFPCPQCYRKFKAKDYVATHIKLTHEGIRSFICEECGEAIRTQDALRQHMLTHTDYAPFECEICKKSFKDRARLKKHSEIHSSKKFKCDECGLQLNSRTTLNQHKVVHSDEMRHKCDYCGKAFKRSKSLKSHLLLHSGIKPYSCEFCDKTFTSGSNCRLHMKKTHPVEFNKKEASGEKKYTKNIPKLAVLKSVVQAGIDLIPVVSKQSGNFAFGKKAKTKQNGSASFEIEPTVAGVAFNKHV